MTDDAQPLLFRLDDLAGTPAAEWRGMPAYDHVDLAPRYQVIVAFATAADLVDFGALIGQRITPTETGRQLQSIWFPPAEIGVYRNKRYIDRANL